MRELKLFREISRRESTRAAQRPVHNPYNMLVQSKFGAGLIEHMALPENVKDAQL